MSEEVRYQNYLAAHYQTDKVDSTGMLLGSLLILAVLWLKGIIARFPALALCWFATTQCPTLLPGLASVLLPSLYLRHRERAVIASKLLAAAAYPVFRLAWHAPGSPADARLAFGDGWRWLPVHPLALVQSGALFMLVTSARHSLRFKAQLLCQLVTFYSVAQAEQLARRMSFSPGQHLATLSQATMLQVVCGLGLPLCHHYVFDRQRRLQWLSCEQRRDAQQQARQPQAFFSSPPL